MTDERKGIICVLGVVAILMLVYTMNQGESPIDPPEEELAFGANASVGFNEGTVLDMSPHIHFYAPGINPRDQVAACTSVGSCSGNGGCSSCPVKLPHKYPRTMGANVASLIHGNWQGYAANSPDKEWFYMPPEAAVL
jgi:hypothetical protein